MKQYLELNILKRILLHECVMVAITHEVKFAARIVGECGIAITRE